jgi:hypothetical protein
VSRSAPIHSPLASTRSVISRSIARSCLFISIACDITLRMQGQGISPSKELVAAVANLIKKEGMAKAVKRLGISREAASRVAAGLNVRPGTIALAEKNLAAPKGNGK